MPAQLVFPRMKLFTADPAELAASSIQCEAKPVSKTHYLSFIPTLTKKATALQDVVRKEFPDLRHVVTRELAESCDEVEVVFGTTHPVSPEVFEKMRADAHTLAKRHEASLWCTRDALFYESREPDAPKGLKVRMRTEYLGDALVLRIALFPYVLHWSDFSINMTGEPDCSAQFNNMDRNVEFELTDNAPSLDHLRWYLNQIVDMHVAAESLHYADRYTGRRLPYPLLEKMEPPVDVIENMLTVAKEAADWVGETPDCRIHGLVEALTAILAYRRLPN